MNLPAVINTELMPNVLKYKDIIFIDRGPAIGFLGIDPDGKDYIDPKIYEIVISELNHACVPCQPLNATNFTQLLIGSFPSNYSKQPETYAKMMKAIISKYPEDIVEAAIFEIVGDEEWLPPIALVKKALDKTFSIRRNLLGSAINRRDSQDEYIEKWKKRNAIEAIEARIRINKADIERSKHDTDPVWLNSYERCLEQNEKDLIAAKERENKNVS